MNTFKVIIPILSFMFLMSCGSNIKFPVSNIVPATEISAKANQDKNDNTEIEVTAEYLADPNRLSPPKDFYVVWIVTDNNQKINVGRLVQDGNKKVSLTTKTPYKVKEIFITAEKEGNESFPGKTVITRKKL
jgi:hypothetical protein